MNKDILIYIKKLTKRCTPTPKAPRFFCASLRSTLTQKSSTLDAGERGVMRIGIVH